MAQLIKNLPPCRRPQFDSWVGKSPWRRDSYLLQYSWAVPVIQLVKNPPVIWETWFQPLDWEDHLEKGKSTPSSILAWSIPWTALSMGSQRVGYNWATFTSLHFLFFYVAICFWSITDLQHHVGSCYTISWLNIFIHFKMITTISLITMKSYSQPFLPGDTHDSNHNDSSVS